MNQSEKMIKEFYKDCDIFFTGGSGAVGKAAIEKLLRSCDVHKIYILLREKKGYSVEERLEKIKTSKIFRVLKSEKPDELDKLVPIPGDAMLPILGITPEYAKVLENVSIFFHCAATVRFNEPLKMALKLNVGGTLAALKFAETLKKLKIFMHVSTFFSNPYLKYVEEKVYPSPMDWKLCLKIIEDDSKQAELDILTRKIIIGFPNTYCFTKNLAESVVNDFRMRLPVAIYRPSIVLFAINEPEPGFPPSIIGAMGLFALIGAGLLKGVFLKKDVCLDITPLDMGSIIMIIMAMKAAKEIEARPIANVQVFMCSSFGLQKHTLNQMCNAANKVWEQYPFEKNLLIPWVYPTESRCLYILMVFVYQVIPAFLVDGLLKLFRREPVLLKIARKVYISMEAMTPFLVNQFESGGVTHLNEIYALTDGTDFDIRKSIKRSDTYEVLYVNIQLMVSKIREVLFNEDPSSLERARKILKVKHIIYNVVRGILAYYLLCWIYGVILRQFL